MPAKKQQQHSAANGDNTSSSDQSSSKSGASAEAKSLLNSAARMKKDLLAKIELGADEFQVMDALKSYVSYVSDTAQQLMDSGSLKPAQKLLRGCEKCLKQDVPAQYAFQESFLFTINNSLAQLANKFTDVPLSIKYLEAAIDSCKDPRVKNRDELPLAETYLNIANAHSYLSQFKESAGSSEKAATYASQQCERLERAMTNPQQMQLARDALQEQYTCQLNLKIMALHVTGQNWEKLKDFSKALEAYKTGKSCVEMHFGTESHLYPMFATAMGGCKLKTKYQTPTENRRTKSRSNSRSASDDSGKKQKKAKIPKKKSAKAPPKSDLPKISHQRNTSVKELKRPAKTLRPSSAKPMSISSSVTKIDVLKSHHKGASRGTSNKMLENADTWSKVHCHQVPRGIPTSNTRKNRTSATLNMGSLTSFREAGFTREAKFLSVRSGSSSSRHKTEDIRYLEKMRRESDQRTVVCKNGPLCKNHDWDKRSPIVKVCTRDKDCVNHDWSHVDRNNSPFKVICKRGPSCSNHDWNRRSPMQRLKKKLSKKTLISAETIQYPPAQPMPQMPVPAPAAAPSTSHDHQCMMHQNERMYQQQMATMRQLQEDQFKMLEMVMDNKGISSNPCQPSACYNGQTIPLMPPQMYPAPSQMMMYPQQSYYSQGGPAAQYQNESMYHPEQNQMEQSEGSSSDSGVRQNSSSESDRHHKKRKQSSSSSSSARKSSSEESEKPKKKKSKKQSSKKLNMSSKKSLPKDSPYKQESIKDSPKQSSYSKRQQSIANSSMDGHKFKNSSTKNVRYDASFNDRDGGYSLGHSASAEQQEFQRQQSVLLQSVKSNKSIGKKTDSPISSDRSYHAPEEPISKNDAAIRIQKNFKRMQAQQEYQIAKNKQSALFRTALHGRMVDCTMSRQGKFLMSLKFLSKGRPEVLVSFKGRNIPVANDLGEKVKKLISKARDMDEVESVLMSDISLKMLQNSPQKLQVKFKKMARDSEESSSKSRSKSKSSSSSSSSSSSDKSSKSKMEKTLKKERKLRQKQIEEEIEKIKRNNRFTAFTIDEVVHRQNDEVLAQNDQFKPAFPGQYEGLDPIVISRVVVGKRNNQHYGSDNSDHESEYSSDHSYEFQIGPIDYSRRLVKKKPNIKSIVKIQALIRGFLARRRYRLLSKIVYEGEHLILNYRWNCVLTKYSSYDYMLDIISDQGEQMQKKLIELPASEEEICERFVEYLRIKMKHKKLIDIDLRLKEAPKTPSVSEKPIIGKVFHEKPRPKPQSPTSKSMLLWLDVVRDHQTYRVNVHTRSDPEYPYQIKVNKIGKTHQVFLNVRKLPDTSIGIREYIWYHMQVSHAGGQLRDVYFAEQRLFEDAPSPPKPSQQQVAQSRSSKPHVDESNSYHLDQMMKGNSSEIKSKMTDHFRNTSIPQQYETMLQDSSKVLVVKDKVMAKQQYFQFALSFDLDNRNVFFSLENLSTKHVLCHELALESHVVAAVCGAEIHEIYIQKKLKDKLAGLIESQADKLRTELPQDFQALLVEQLSQAGSARIDSDVGMFEENKLNTVFDESESNNQSFDQSENDSPKKRRVKSASARQVSTKGTAKGGAMYQFAFEGDASSGQFKLTLRNMETKKYLCQKEPVKTDLFDKARGDRNQALEDVKERIIELIRENGHKFDKNANRVPECLQVIN